MCRTARTDARDAPRRRRARLVLALPAYRLVLMPEPGHRPPRLRRQAPLREKCDADRRLGYDLDSASPGVMVDAHGDAATAHGRLRPCRRLTPRSSMTPVPFRVADRRQETEDTWTLEPRAAERAIARLPASASSRCCTRSVPARCRSRSAGTSRPRTSSVARSEAAGSGHVLCGLRARPGGWRSRALRHPLARGDAEGADVAGRWRGPRPAAPVRLPACSNRERFGNVAILYGAWPLAEVLYPQSPSGAAASMPRWR